MFHLTNIDREHILDAIQDVLRELEEDPLAEYVSQGCIDKLLSAQEILDEKPRHSGVSPCLATFSSFSTSFSVR